MAADNFFIPNAEEFFASILFIFIQCTACLDVRDGDQAELLSRRLEHYEETLRVMYQRITVSRPDQGALRCDIEQLLNALRRILERLESVYCENNEENDYEDIATISVEQIQALREGVFFRWTDIERILCFSTRTLPRRRQSGIGLIRGALQSRGWRIQRHRIMAALQRLDQVMSALR